MGKVKEVHCFSLYIQFLIHAVATLLWQCAISSFFLNKIFSHFSENITCRKFYLCASMFLLKPSCWEPSLDVQMCRLKSARGSDTTDRSRLRSLRQLAYDYKQGTVWLVSKDREIACVVPSTINMFNLPQKKTEPVEKLAFFNDN